MNILLSSEVGSDIPHLRDSIWLGLLRRWTYAQEHSAAFGEVELPLKIEQGTVVATR